MLTFKNELKTQSRGVGSYFSSKNDHIMEIDINFLK